jgi:hypothetical protein
MAQAIKRNTLLSHLQQRPFSRVVAVAGWLLNRNSAAGAMWPLTNKIEKQTVQAHTQCFSFCPVKTM